MPLAPLPRSLLRSAMRFNRGCPGYPPLSPAACRATSRVMGNLYPRMLHFIWRKSLGRLGSDRTAPAAWGRDYFQAMAVAKFRRTISLRKGGLRAIFFLFDGSNCLLTSPSPGTERKGEISDAGRAQPEREAKRKPDFFYLNRP
jgi:hypothetical protein